VFGKVNGLPAAFTGGTSGARHYKELTCWQLANELKLRIYKVVKRPVVARDVRFRDQIRDSAASGPRNISEGFGRRTHADFAHYLDIARGSLMETQNHLEDARDRRYLTSAECNELVILTKRACGAVAGLQRYLRNNPDPPF
jgi:four helix bundle protein